MKVAGKSGLLYTLILDDAGNAVLKNMRTGGQAEINFKAEVADIVKEIKVTMAALN